ncbi:MAG: glycosyltransferase [Desulfobulbaceae bacterium]|nr:glycosyltransferase [Desulfobulbaceae bacterium]
MHSPRILWWGRTDRGYSRNRLVLKLFRQHGCLVNYFHPLSSPLGYLEAYCRGPLKPDLIWVPCFRQADMASAAHWAAKWSVPLVFDPLISAYQKDIFEREKAAPGSRKAEKHRQWESALCAKADLVVADTPAHADFFHHTLGVARDKLQVLYVGAEEDLFVPMAYPPQDSTLEVLFYGSFLRLQGPEVVVAAAQKARSINIRWTLLGEGDLKPGLQEQARGFENIRFEPWTEYSKLPERLGQAHILLGIFGTSMKSELVIPNKMFQSMAVARPVITRRSIAYRETLIETPEIGWVEPGNPDELLATVCQWFDHPQNLAQRGLQTRQLFEHHFREQKLATSLRTILNRFNL